jgi:predicted GNAT family acetyltransferase
MSHEVVHNTDEHRYEIHVDGVLAGWTEANDRGDEVVFPHTRVLDGFEGRGLASVLVKKALDDVRERGKKVVPTCPYVAAFIDKHPQYADLLA